MEHFDDIEPTGSAPCSVPPYPLIGRRYTLKFNGNRSFNGPLYGRSTNGEVQPPLESNRTVYDVLRAIIDDMEKENSDLEHLQWLNLELHAPNDQDQRP